MAELEKNWYRLDLDDGWQAIVPESDIKPHATIVLIYPNGEREGELAGWNCPCKPFVDWKEKIISHNSFDGREHFEPDHIKENCRACQSPIPQPQ